MQMRTFPKSGPYLPTKKIGKNNPRAKEIMETNRLRDEWNRNINRAKAQGVPEESLMHVKREIILPVSQSIKRSEGKKDPQTFRNILARGAKVLAIMIKEVEHESRETWAKAWGEALDNFMKFCIAKVSGVDLNRRRDDRGR